MDWAHEPFRKIYQPAGAVLTVPSSAIGFLLELHFYVDAQGRFEVPRAETFEQLSAALARSMGAHRTEYPRCASDLASLVRVNAITCTGSVLSITNYVQAQDHARPFDRMSYIKVYRPWGSWMALSLRARALGKRMLLCVDDDGAIDLRGDKATRLSDRAVNNFGRALAMHYADRRHARADLEELADDRYIILASDRLVVRNYREAQAQRGRLAERRRREVQDHAMRVAQHEQLLAVGHVLDRILLPRNPVEVEVVEHPARTYTDIVADAATVQQPCSNRAATVQQPCRAVREK